MRDQAVICGEAHAHRAVLSDHARVEDHAHVDGGRVENYARLSGDGEIIQGPKFVGRVCLGGLGGELTNMLFPFEGVELAVGKLAI